MSSRECRYYVNTNFFVDLEEGRRGALEFLRRRRGVCTSRILVREYAAVGRQAVARRLAAMHGISIRKVPVLRLLKAARRVLAEWGVREPGENTLVDVAHILAALRLGARFFVTSDRAACNRAIRLGIKCINHRTGEEYAPP